MDVTRTPQRPKTALWAVFLCLVFVFVWPPAYIILGGQYTDNGDGTISEAGSGLMWQQVTSPDGYTQSGASTYCLGLTLATHTDWRLPTADEVSLVGPSDSTFTYGACLYWSSTYALSGTTPTSSPLKDKWYAIDPSFGKVLRDKDAEECVRCVRKP